MIRHYFKVAYRNMFKHKTLSFIHIIGLAVAIATATLLYLTATFELSYNKHLKDYSKIGLLYFQTQPQNGLQNSATAPTPLAPLLKTQIPEIAYISRYYNEGIHLRHGEKQLQSNNKYVDADFLPIFSLPTVQGDNHALEDLDNIVIDEDIAKNLFSSNDVIGKQVEVLAGGQWQTKTISAVLEKLPSNSSLNFNTLLRFEQKPNYKQYKEEWGHQDHNLFVKMKSDPINDIAFTQATRSFIKQYYKDSERILKRDGALANKAGDYLSLHILPIADYHLNNKGLGDAASPTFPWILLLISGLILFVACSNFINLSLASSLVRNREIGTRKTLGGTISSLTTQLWIEALLLCFIALFLGLGIAFILLPEYNANMNYRLSIGQLFVPQNLLIFTLSFITLTLFAGGYPAWRIARTNVIANLKGTANIRSGRLRNSLTVIQFTIAMVLIVATIVIGSQLHYITNRPLGFDKTDVISIPIGSGIDQERALQQMRIELASLPWVKGITASDINLGLGRDGSTANSRFGFEYEGKQIYSNFMRIDYDYAKTLGIKVLKGRDFDRTFSSDTAAILINRRMAEQLGDVENIVGKTLDLDGNPQVIGIIDDFNFQTLHSEVQPLTLSINPNQSSVEYLFVRVESNNPSETIQAIENTWKKINPKANVSPSYLDENTNNMYKAEQRFSRIIIGGASTAILIACLGLFALSLLMINRRVKEIGIRKTLGSSVSGIVLLLSKDFMKLLFISFLLASPLSWWMMSGWLDDFAYHIDISWWMITLAGMAIMTIALSTVAVQAIQAARANPVDSLKDD
ncbi:ABC transporter permease [Sphingobacterium sp. SG20118]|uniref:ABC transporter permease n=1 Tax=Sphingobacterium sp. SG20118 TaxID=3367156 RepID=UPI0037DFC976